MRYCIILLTLPFIISCKHTAPVTTYCHEGIEPVFQGHRMIETIRQEEDLNGDGIKKSAAGYQIGNAPKSTKKTLGQATASRIGARIWLTFTNTSAHSLDVEICEIAGANIVDNYTSGICKHLETPTHEVPSGYFAAGKFSRTNMEAGDIWAIEIEQPFSCQLPVKATLAYTRAVSNADMAVHDKRIVESCVIPFSGVPTALPITLLDPCK